MRRLRSVREVSPGDIIPDGTGTRVKVQYVVSHHDRVFVVVQHPQDQPGMHRELKFRGGEKVEVGA